MMTDVVMESGDACVPPLHGVARLLCVDGQDVVPPALLAALADQGVEVLGVADSLDDGLRQALMAAPSMILLPYRDESALKFLAALDYMRSASFSPFVVLIADGDHGHVLERCDRFYRLSVIPRERIGDQLVPHLLRLARQGGGED